MSDLSYEDYMNPDALPGETERDRAFRYGAASFDREYYNSYGRYPEESPLYGTTPPPQATRSASPGSDERRARIEALVTGGATEGERAAARAALLRIDASAAEHEAERLARDLQDEHDYEDAVAHGEA